MKLEIIPAFKVLEFFSEDFSLPKDYINRDRMYNEDWLHFVADDYSNDAFIYLMPGNLHNFDNCLWISAFEVRVKNTGFGSDVIKSLVNFAKQLHYEGLALHALNADAKRFYQKNGFGDSGNDEVFYFQNEIIDSIKNIEKIGEQVDALVYKIKTLRENGSYNISNVDNWLLQAQNYYNICLKEIEAIKKLKGNSDDIVKRGIYRYSVAFKNSLVTLENVYKKFQVLKQTLSQSTQYGKYNIKNIEDVDKVIKTYIDHLRADYTQTINEYKIQEK